MPNPDPYAHIAQPAAGDADPYAAIAEHDKPDTDTASSSLQPLARTPGNYAKEAAYGVGRGLKNDVVGFYEAVRHPHDTVTGLVKQNIVAGHAATLANKQMDAGRGMKSLAGLQAYLENAPIVGSMVRKAESGDGYVSPESVGAAAEGMTTIAAPELLGKGIKAGVTSNLVTKSIPKGLITQLIRPMAADVKFGKNPTEAVLREGLTGNTLEQLGDKTFDRLHEIGRELDTKANDPSIANTKVDTSGAMQPLNDALKDALKSGNRKLFRSLSELKKEIEWKWKPVRTPNGGVVMRPDGLKNMTMSPAEALEFKRQIGDRIRWDGNNPFNNDINAALGSVYGKLKDTVNQAVPGLKDLNERYSDLVGAAKAIERRTAVANRNHYWSLSDIALGASGHLPTALARKELGHPAVTTRVAQGLYRAKGLSAPPISPAIIIPGSVGNGQRTDEQVPPASSGGQSSVVKPKDLIDRAKQMNPSATGQVAYTHTAINPETNHQIGSNDGVRWYDMRNGQQVG
jgi:hypothetical protein